MKKQLNLYQINPQTLTYHGISKVSCFGFGQEVWQ